MHGHSRIAAAALLRVLASRTEQRRREAAAVQKQQHLIAGREMPLDRRDERCRQPLAARMPIQIDDVQARRSGGADSPR